MVDGYPKVLQFPPFDLTLFSSFNLIETLQMIQMTQMFERIKVYLESLTEIIFFLFCSYFSFLHFLSWRGGRKCENCLRETIEDSESETRKLNFLPVSFIFILLFFYFDGAFKSIKGIRHFNLMLLVDNIMILEFVSAENISPHRIHQLFC